MRKKKIVEVFEGGNFMSLSLKERKVIVKEISEHYRRAKKKEKGKKLVPYIRETLPILKKFNEVNVDNETEMPRIK